MSAYCSVPGQTDPFGSIREWSHRTLRVLTGIFMAAGVARVPSRRLPVPKETASPREDSAGPPIWWQIALYGTLLASMLANRYLRFENGGTPDSFFSTAFLVQDAIAALTAFPAVYAKLQFKTDQPFFAQLGVVFAAGMGWQHLVFSVAPHLPAAPHP